MKMTIASLAALGALATALDPQKAQLRSTCNFLNEQYSGGYNGNERAKEAMRKVFNYTFGYRFGSNNFGWTATDGYPIPNPAAGHELQSVVDAQEVLQFACAMPAALPGGGRFYDTEIRNQIQEAFPLSKYNIETEQAFSTNLWAGSSVQWADADGVPFGYDDLNNTNGPYFKGVTRYCDPAVDGADCMDKLSAWQYKPCSAAEFKDQALGSEDDAVIEALLCSREQCCEGYKCKTARNDDGKDMTHTDYPGEVNGCVGLSSGDQCTVGCKAGFVAMREPKPFTLFCDLEGHFKVPSENKFECKPSPCDLNAAQNGPGPAATNAAGADVVYEFYRNKERFDEEGGVLNANGEKVIDGTDYNYDPLVKPDFDSGDKFTTHCAKGYHADTNSPYWFALGVKSTATHVNFTDYHLQTPDRKSVV